jgi:hypothetical protein
LASASSFNASARLASALTFSAALRLASMSCSGGGSRFDVDGLHFTLRAFVEGQLAGHNSAHVTGSYT